MTAVIYARYSSDSQREASIEGQLRDCKDYAEKNGITVVDVGADHGDTVLLGVVLAVAQLSLNGRFTLSVG